MQDVRAAIAEAEALLPGVAAAEGENDPRWQAIIEVSEFIQSDPEPIWQFIVRWGSHQDDDLQAAIATCLLEHFLEYHFQAYFPLVEQRATQDTIFAKVFCLCSKFGQSEEQEKAQRFDALKRRLRGSS
jgi:hypothetical protein